MYQESFVSFITIASAIVVVYFILGFFYHSRQRRIYPPGPRPLPILGNILDLPRKEDMTWSYWQNHKLMYGPISSIRVLGKVIVVLNDADVAFELLDKRSKIFSDRPSLTFSGEMIGWDRSPSHMNFTNRFMTHRRQMHQTIGTKNGISHFYPLQELEMRRFLLHILNEPTNLFKSIHLLVGAITLGLTYDYNVNHVSEDPLVEFVSQVAEEASDAFEPGRWLVDVIPVCEEICFWVPGTGFKKIASRWRRNMEEVMNIPYLFAKKNIELGNARPSLVSILLEERDTSEEQEDIIKWTAGVLYAAGVDTTSGTLRKLFLVLALFPEVQAKAQEEIDFIMGGERLPTFADRERLPYICALTKEIFRWNTVAPVGFPHSAREDTEYNGYYIPKAATIIPNIGGFLNDAHTYTDPSKFMPERFLGENPEKDPFSLVFGFGRRICPGRELAESTVYLCAAMSLAVFNIVKPPNRELEVKFASGLVCKPEKFDVSIKPRNKSAEDLIKLIGNEESFGSGSAESIKAYLNKSD